MKDITVHFMAKLPGQGRDKTRLRAELQDEAVDAIYLGLVAQMEHLSQELLTAGMSCIWWWDGKEPFNIPDNIPGCQHLKQPFGNLGGRLEYACRGRNGYQVFLGMDCPLFTFEHLREALQMVGPPDSGNQAVLWPAEDGGFVTMVCPPLPAGCLDGVPWGAENTLEATQAALEGLGWEVKIPSPALWDVDRAEDFFRLVEHLEDQKSGHEICPRLSTALLGVKGHNT